MPGSKDNHPLYAAINARLGAVAASSSTPLPWSEAWASLGPQSTQEERLAVYRAVRAAGSVPAEAGFFLIAWTVDLLTDDIGQERLREAEERLKAIRHKYGLGEEASAEADDAPAEYREELQRCYNAFDALYAATLEEVGESEMARLFRENREKFGQRYAVGRQFFQRPGGEEKTEGDDWLDLLQEAVSACIEADSPMGPLGLRFREEEGFWEVWIYATSVELVGGARDGEVVVPGFRLDLEQLRQEFASVIAYGWNALGLCWPEGPHVYVKGVFRGREVYLQVLAHAPHDEEPGLKLDATRRRRRTE